MGTVTRTPGGHPCLTPSHERSVHRRSEHPVYAELAASEEFAELRRRYRGFVFPMTVAFLAWYLLYVVLSSWAHDFMGTKVVGNINVALVFGLLQFVSTFLIASALRALRGQDARPARRASSSTSSSGGADEHVAADTSASRPSPPTLFLLVVAA